jgi:preprotein translocase subunit SecE
MTEGSSGVRAAGEKTLGFFDRAKTFLKDVRTEMRKVTTPSGKEVRATTLVVLITVFLFAVYFFGVDKVIGFVVDKIFAWARVQ